MFDVSMKGFIAPSIIKVLFVLGIVAISLGALVLFVAGIQGDDAGFLIVVAGPATSAEQIDASSPSR